MSTKGVSQPKAFALEAPAEAAPGSPRELSAIGPGGLELQI